MMAAKVCVSDETNLYPLGYQSFIAANECDRDNVSGLQKPQLDSLPM
jgi:hypothetical protein